MKRFLTISAALILTYGISFADGAQKSSAEKAGDATENALATAGDGAEKGVKEAGEGIDEGLEATGKGVGKAAEQTVKGTVTAGKATANAMEKTADAVSDFFTGDDDEDRDKVKAAQRALQSKGYYGGPIDGIVGPKTRNGLREYQGDANLTVTGQLDGATARKLGVSD